MKLNNQHSLKKKIKRKKIKKSRKTNLKRKNSILKKLLGGAEAVQSHIHINQMEQIINTNIHDELTLDTIREDIGKYLISLSTDNNSENTTPDGIRIPFIIHINFLRVDNIYSGEYIYKNIVDGHAIFENKKSKLILFWDKGAWVIVRKNDKENITSSNRNIMPQKGYRFTPTPTPTPTPIDIDNNNKFPSKNIAKWEIIKNGEWTDFKIVKPIITYKNKNDTDFNHYSPSTKPFTFEINVTVDKKKQEQFELIVLNELLKLRTNEELNKELKEILTNKRIFISFNDIQTGGGKRINAFKKFVRKGVETVTAAKDKAAATAAATAARQASETAYKKSTAAATAVRQASETAYKKSTSAANSVRRHVSDKKKTVTAIIKIYPTENLSIDDKKKEKLSEIITDKLNDRTTLEQLKKLDIDIVGDEGFKDQFKINSASISNSESKKKPAKKKSHTLDEIDINKELIKLIRESDQNDNIFITRKKSLSIVYKLEDILKHESIVKLIEKYKTSQKDHPDFSKYADDIGVSVVKLFKMPDTNNKHEFTHVLISRNFEGKKHDEDFTTTLKLLIGEIEVSATETQVGKLAIAEGFLPQAAATSSVYTPIGTDAVPAQNK